MQLKMGKEQSNNAYQYIFHAERTETKAVRTDNAPKLLLIDIDAQTNRGNIINLSERHRNGNSQVISYDGLQKCQKTIERSLEILDEWKNTDDIQMQIQFASVLIAKLDRLRKSDFVKENAIKINICTLLRNVIRLNTTDFLLGEKQVEVLKQGFLLLLKEDLARENLFTFNRSLKEERLMTMPAWE